MSGDWWKGSENLTLGGGMNWQSEISNNWGGAPANAVGNGTIEQDAYTLAHAFIDYQINSNLSANLKVDNLFDQEYFTNVGFYNGVYWGSPRSVKLTLRAQF